MPYIHSVHNFKLTYLGNVTLASIFFTLCQMDFDSYIFHYNLPRTLFLKPFYILNTFFNVKCMICVVFHFFLIFIPYVLYFYCVSCIFFHIHTIHTVYQKKFFFSFTLSTKIIRFSYHNIPSKFTIDICFIDYHICFANFLLDLIL